MLPVESPAADAQFIFALFKCQMISVGLMGMHYSKAQYLVKYSCPLGWINTIIISHASPDLIKYFCPRSYLDEWTQSLYPTPPQTWALSSRTSPLCCCKTPRTLRDRRRPSGPSGSGRSTPRSASEPPLLLSSFYSLSSTSPTVRTSWRPPWMWWWNCLTDKFLLIDLFLSDPSPIIGYACH